jgi:hypothetical protein
MTAGNPKNDAKSSHSSDSHNQVSDPAAAKLISGIRKSMIAVSGEGGNRGSIGKGDPAMAEKMITENLQAYLSRADQFATRMSQLVRASRASQIKHHE